MNQFFKLMTLFFNTALLLSRAMDGASFLAGYPPAPVNLVGAKRRASFKILFCTEQLRRIYPACPMKLAGANGQTLPNPGVI